MAIAISAIVLAIYRPESLSRRFVVFLYLFVVLSATISGVGASVFVRAVQARQTNDYCKELVFFVYDDVKTSQTMLEDLNAIARGFEPKHLSGDTDWEKSFEIENDRLVRALSTLEADQKLRVSCPAGSLKIGNAVQFFRTVGISVLDKETSLDVRQKNLLQYKEGVEGASRTLYDVIMYYSDLEESSEIR